jgi:hypothetical protein
MTALGLRHLFQAHWKYNIFPLLAITFLLRVRRRKETIFFPALSTNAKKAHTALGAIHMLAVAGVWKKKRDDLKSKRNSLFEKYAKHPEEFHLALEIKKIDDEIADCTQHVEQERRSERASSGKKLQPAAK